MQIDSLTKAEEVQVLIEYPTASDPNSTDFGDGAQEFLYTGIGTNDGINWNISHDLPVYALSGIYKVRNLRITRGNLDDLIINASTIKSKGFDSNVSFKIHVKISLIPYFKQFQTLQLQEMMEMIRQILSSLLMQL